MSGFLNTKYEEANKIEHIEGTNVPGHKVPILVKYL